MHSLILFLLALTHSVSSYPQTHSFRGWHLLAPLIGGPRQEHSVASLHSDIYLIGGHTTLMEQSETGLSVPSLALAQAYSTLTNSWRDIAALPIPVNHGNLASVRRKLYLLGGLTGNNTWSPIGNSYAYDPSRDAWEVLPSLPIGQERGASAVGVWRDTIILAGGLRELNFNTFAQPSSTAVSTYNTRTRRWSSLPNLPEARDHVGGAVHGNTMYVIGGRINGSANVRGTVFALDLSCPETGWTEKARMPTPRGGLATAISGSKIFTFGGEGDPTVIANGVYSNVEVYDVKRDRWQILEPMLHPRHGTNAAAVGGRIYIPGGGNVSQAGPVSVNDVYIP